MRRLFGRGWMLFRVDCHCGSMHIDGVGVISIYLYTNIVIISYYGVDTSQMSNDRNRLMKVGQMIG